jgi:heme/copper-type cytochrome/quinol oxidase subunit 4
MVQQLERLTTNPYAWVFFGFIILLPYILKFLRRFYPKHWQEVMQKEASCILEFQKSKERKSIRNFTLIGFFLSVMVSYVFIYLVLDIHYKFEVFIITIFLIMVIFALFRMIKEYQVLKKKNCNNVIIGYKYVKIIGILIIIALIVMLISLALKVNELKVF